MSAAPVPSAEGPLGLSPFELLFVGTIGLIATCSLAVWVLGGLAGLLFGDGWPTVPLLELPGVIRRLADHSGDPRRAWPADASAGLPGPAAFYVVGALLLVVLAGALSIVLMLLRRRATQAEVGRGAARWATNGQLRALLVVRATAGRLTLGRHGRRLIAAEPRASVILFAPTQTYKTTGLAVPAILEWSGPVVAVSIKADLLRDTWPARCAHGATWVYDPTGSTDLGNTQWTPLAACDTWPGALRTATALASTARPENGTLASADFWYASAAKLLAPLLYAAATSGRSMADVVRWVDTLEQTEVRDAIELTDTPAARHAAEASWKREPKTRSSIATTAETVLTAYSDPHILRSAHRADLRPGHLLDDPAATLYLCATRRDQHRLAPVFVALLQELLDAVDARVARSGRPLDPPLLIVIDEAANIAPLPDLDELASTAAGLGIQLLTIFQDLGQVHERWGPDRAATIVNNHRAKLFGSGLADRHTLTYVAQLLGDAEIGQQSHTAGDGRRSSTTSTSYRQLAPANVLREGQPGSVIAVYSHLPPTRLKLRPFFADKRLTRLAAGSS